MWLLIYMKINGDLILKQSLSGNETDYAPSIKIVKDTFEAMGVHKEYLGGQVIDFNNLKELGIYVFDTNTTVSNAPSDFNANALSQMIVFPCGNSSIAQILFDRDISVYFRLCNWTNWRPWYKIPFYGESPYLATRITDGYKGMLSTPVVYPLKNPFASYLCTIQSVGDSKVTSTSMALVSIGALSAGKTGAITWVTSQPTYATVTLGEYDGSIGGLPLRISSTTYISVNIARVY